MRLTDDGSASDVLPGSDAIHRRPRVRRLWKRFLKDGRKDDLFCSFSALEQTGFLTFCHPLTCLLCRSSAPWDYPEATPAGTTRTNGTPIRTGQKEEGDTQMDGCGERKRSKETERHLGVQRERGGGGGRGEQNGFLWAAPRAQAGLLVCNSSGLERRTAGGKKYVQQERWRKKNTQKDALTLKKWRLFRRQWNNNANVKNPADLVRIRAGSHWQMTPFRTFLFKIFVW